MSTVASIEFRLSEDDIRLIAEEVARVIAAPASARRGWMSITRAAEYLDWPKERLYKLAASGDIPHRKQGNRLSFHPDELDRWLDQFEQGPFVKPRRHRTL